MSERKFECEKCGSSDINVKYRPAEEICSWKSSKYLNERLVCNCRRCQYQWTEEPSKKANK